jgi:hypothetical protein
MPIVTYMSDSEREYWLSVHDDQYSPLLHELFETYGERWVIIHSHIRYGFLRRKTQTLYSLYKHVGLTEYQVINFYRDNTAWSINTYVSKELIIAYIYGLLGRKNHGQ